MNNDTLVCKVEDQPQPDAAPPVPPPSGPSTLPAALAPLAAFPPLPVAAPPRQRRRPRGRIARLPLPVRNLVNHALRDGSPYADILGLLAAHGFNNLKRHDILAWSRLGYRDWLAGQERFEQAHARSDRAAALLDSLREDGRCLTADLNESLLSDQFNQLLQAVDESSLKRLLADKPDEFFRLAKALSAFTAARAQREQIQLQRLKYELEMRKIHEREMRRLKPHEIPPEIRARVEAAAKLHDRRALFTNVRPAPLRAQCSEGETANERPCGKSNLTIRKQLQQNKLHGRARLPPSRAFGSLLHFANDVGWRLPPNRPPRSA